MLMSLIAACASDTPDAPRHSTQKSTSLASGMQKLSLPESEASEQYGGVVAGAGDVNGDGFGDVLVGMSRANDREGAAFLYYGSLSGVDVEAGLELVPPSPDRDSSFGGNLKGVGDVDGDGFGDIAVTATDPLNTGRVYFYPGSEVGLDTGASILIEPSDPGIGDGFGLLMSGHVDLDGDGYEDLVIGASNDDDGYDNSGSVYVYFGGWDGPDSSSEIQIRPSDAAESDHFGTAIAAAGDLNGDGLGDVLIGAPYARDNLGVVYVYHGATTGLLLSEVLMASDANMAEYFGKSVAGLGDADGDGFNDLLIGAPYDDSTGSDSGSAYAYDSVGTKKPVEQKLTASDGDHRDLYGSSLSAAGDLDGDGFSDAVIGAGSADGDIAEDAGVVYVYYGGPAGLSGEVRITLETLEQVRFGTTLSSAGDVNGDGLDDLIVSAPGQDDYRGAAYLIYGQLRDGDGDGLSSQEDCDDADPGVGGPTERHPDSDGDGYGARDAVAVVCPDEAGYLDDDSDCDDSDPHVNLPHVQYTDSDGDGFGDASSSEAACPGDAGYSEDRSDCDDTEPTTHPGAVDTCGDGVDSDCDGWGDALDDEDDDELSHAAELALGTDPCNPDTDGDGIPDGLDDDPLGGLDTAGAPPAGCGCGGGSAWMLLPLLSLRWRDARSARARQRR